MAKQQNDGNDSLDKVRDILIGAYARETEQKITHLNDRWQQDTSVLRDETRKRLDSLESYLKNEFTTVVERITREQGERAKALHALSSELGSTLKALDARLTDLDERVQRDGSEIRADLRQQTTDLRDELSAAQRELEAAHHTQVAALRSDKVDRAALGTLLSDLAHRLTNEADRGQK